MSKLMTDPITLVWTAWLVFWALSALYVKAAVRTESAASRLAHSLPLIVAALLLMMHSPHNWLGQHVLPWHGDSRYNTGLALVIAGCLFSIWARVTLGRNWSATVTVKDRHKLVVKGPYRLVRHPIYTGMLLSFIGTAIAQNEWRSWLAVLIVWLAFWRKWRLEERFMRDTFGERYADYRAHVPAIVPYKLPR